MLANKVVLYIAILSQLMFSCRAQTVTDNVASVEPLRTGAEVLFSRDCPYAAYYLLTGKSRIAIVGNQTSIVGNTHLVDTLLAEGMNVTKIFCPEHGFRGKAEAGARVNDEIDVKTGLPIVSLYGKNKKPTPEQMKDIDAVVFDLQDVGCRFYTYISTLHYVMEACAERGIPCILLDRPNPNCHYVDGPVLDKKYQSFIGMHPVPIVYGLTIGEYAQMINGEDWLKDGIKCDLSVVPMQNYRRDSSYVLPVPPSPNLRNAHAISLYPSVCFFESTNVDVGRGTDFPFEVFTFGADTLDLRQHKAPDRIDLWPLQEMYRRHGNDASKPFFKNTNGFEKLAGNDLLRKQIKAGTSEDEIRASWEPALSKYKEIRKKYLLYPDVN